MTDFCWPILLAEEIGQLYRSYDIRFTGELYTAGTKLNTLHL